MKRRSSAAWYALRRTLPEWSFEENLRELADRLPEYGIDELIVKVDTEEFSHGQPPLELVERYQEKLFRIKEVLAQKGIVYSLNPWITLGHNDRGRDSRTQLPGLRTMVGHDGTRCRVCACPLSAVWRNHITALWTLYARTDPRVIWVEDDIRTFNHNPVRFGCFCPDHMKRYSQRIGKRITRGQLVAAILKPGRPHPWRKAYLDVQVEVMIETAAFLSKTVHRVNPRICMGLMSSGPYVHCLEGRQWHGFSSALADGTPLYSRPPLGNYKENGLSGLYYSPHSIKHTRYCLPPDVVEQTEVENFPFTQYSKSATFTFLQMAISFAYGSRGVTMNLYDHCGTPMDAQPAYGTMLKKRKPFLDAVARRCQEPGTYRGVQLLFNERQSYAKRLKFGDGFSGLVADGGDGMLQLEQHGIPTTFDTSPVVALSGQTIRSYPDDQIREMLGKGLLLDAGAAFILYQRGFGPEIGLKKMAAPVFLDTLGAFAAEEYHNVKFGGKAHAYLSMIIPGLGSRPDFSVLQPVAGAEVISSLVDADARRHHVAMYAYRNRQGGRMAVSALDLGSAMGAGYATPLRARQLRRVMQWLSRNRFPLHIKKLNGAYPLVFRKDTERYSVLGFFNLTLDPWEGIEFECWDKRSVGRIQVLSASGRWGRDARLAVTGSGGRHVFTYDRDITFETPLFITVYWATQP